VRIRHEDLFTGEYKKSGKKLDMGKVWVRFNRVKGFASRGRAARSRHPLELCAVISACSSSR